MFTFNPVLNVFYLMVWYCVTIEMSFAPYRKVVNNQSWPTSAHQTQVLPWSCSALWAKRVPLETSSSPRWASAPPWLWFTWGPKETPLLRWQRWAHTPLWPVFSLLWGVRGRGSSGVCVHSMKGVSPHSQSRMWTELWPEKPPLEQVTYWLHVVIKTGS